MRQKRVPLGRKSGSKRRKRVHPSKKCVKNTYPQAKSRPNPPGPLLAPSWPPPGPLLAASCPLLAPSWPPPNPLLDPCWPSPPSSIRPVSFFFPLPLFHRSPFPPSSLLPFSSSFSFFSSSFLLLILHPPPFCLFRLHFNPPTLGRSVRPPLGGEVYLSPTPLRLGVRSSTSQKTRENSSKMTKPAFYSNPGGP